MLGVGDKLVNPSVLLVVVLVLKAEAGVSLCLAITGCKDASKSLAHFGYSQGWTDAKFQFFTFLALVYS